MDFKVNKKIIIVFFLLKIVQDAYSEECRCGKAVGGKVIGGVLANVQSYPWLLALYKQSEGQWMFACAATLIHSEWAITAGHCVKNVPDDGFANQGKCYDKTGNIIRCFQLPNNLQLALAITQGRERQLTVSQVIPHTLYNPTLFHHDVALLKLKNKVTCSRDLMLACITEGEHMDYPNTPVIMAGWGQTTESEGGKHPELKQTQLRVESREKCAASTNIHGVLCATGTDFGGRPCKGDSGGPLMYVSDGFNYITGVVSYGSDDCQITGEVKFAKVTDHLDWIRQYVPIHEVKKFVENTDYE